MRPWSRFFRFCGRFLMGVLGKRVFRGGVLMVNLWWNAWLLWSTKSLCARDEKHATFFKFIFGSALSQSLFHGRWSV
jgi:hypothetical protein